jgi:selenide,water dikinase
MSELRLTQYSHGAGCGCKISPAILDQILKDQPKHAYIRDLLVGNDSRDDAAVMDIGNGQAIISTTDFFMPIVDDPVDFGRIASVNAISDIYAMGGSPLMAIGILGWPINTLPPEVARLVLEGAHLACGEANIPLAGGHSIDSPEPIFGLAVTGKIDLVNLKKNAGAREGDILFLTKGLGVGILSTAEKKGLLKVEHKTLARDSMVKMNSIGEIFGKMTSVHAMTDVTGFGLLGHLLEMCQASNVSARLHRDKIPLLHESVLEYVHLSSVPGGCKRNYDSYGHRISIINQDDINVLCDPQTSGGLLVAVDPAEAKTFRKDCLSMNYSLEPIGEIIRQEDFAVYV